MNRPGIYCLKCLETQNIYIGGSKNLRSRKNNHFSDFKLNRSDIKILQEDWNNNFLVQFEILEFTENLEEREDYWIAFYKLNNAYNCLNVFQSQRKNSKVPDSFREKMRLIRKEKWKDPTYRRNMEEKMRKTQFKKGQISLSAKITLAEFGNNIIAFSSAKEAANYFNLSPSSVRASIRRKSTINNIKFYYKSPV